MENKSKFKTIDDYFYITGIILLLILIPMFIYLFYIPGKKPDILPPCLFHLLTGYYCPGCGGTRAAYALLRGKWFLALYYHPLVPYGFIVYVCFMVSQTIERISRRRIAVGLHYRNVYVLAAAAILIFNFAIKNVLHYKYGFVL